MPVNPPKLAALVLVLILVAGCAGVQPTPRIIVQDTQTIVQLDTNTSIKGPDDPSRYTHPAEIGVGQLQTIFDAIRIQPQRLALQKKFSDQNPEQQRVFETDEIATLAPIVKNAFSQASPQERVVFALTKPVGKGHEATVGEMYIKDQQLHFILNCYRLQSEGPELLSACQEFARQGFALTFMKNEFFVGYGKPRLLLGHGAKELLIDFGRIPSSTISGS